MTDTPSGGDLDLGRAVALARAGNVDGARAIGERLLAKGGDPGAANAFLGMLACREGDLGRGADHLTAALSARPGDVTIRLNAAQALIGMADLPGALALLPTSAADADPSFRLWRLRGFACQSSGDFAGAAAAYARVVAHAPQDFESWNNLGNAQAALGDGDASVAALTRAVALRPDVAPPRINLAATLAALGRTDEAEAVLRACAKDFPQDPTPWRELAGLLANRGQRTEARDALGRAAALAPDALDLQLDYGTELATAWRMAESEGMFRRILDRDPAHRDAHVRLALVLEHTNRAGTLPDLIAAAETAGTDAGALAFTRALWLRDADRPEDGLAALAQAADDIEPVRQAQLRGQFLDRLDRPREAFAAFAEMNRRLLADQPAIADLARSYRDELASEAATATADWFAGWRALDPPSGRTPVFLVGFPRSGTTLLDTLLMGHPDVQVLEERPALTAAETAIGGFERLRDLDAASLERARDAYFAEAARWIDLRADSLLIDKFPLHMNKVPLIHRLFPDARFVLALRHPADVVLSCFITTFRANAAMTNFVDLATAAQVYDASFRYWDRMRAILPIAVHEVRYEAMIADPAAELRPLFDWLRLNWRAEVLDHGRTAAARGVITTASYGQVTKPLYARAAGRWRRYAEELAPVMPILSPWIGRLGYDRPN